MNRLKYLETLYSFSSQFKLKLAIPMEIELYTSEGCANCRKVKKILPKILPEFGLNYENSVIERDVSNTEVLADLIMLDTEIIPTIHFRNAILTGDQATNEETLRTFLAANIKKINNCFVG